MAFNEQSTKEYLAFRVAIASGLFASLGATLAWILWIAYKAWSAELGLTIIVGGLIGFIVHWCGHYLHVASRERDGYPHEPDEDEDEAHGGSRSRAAIIWATGFGFLGLVSEHLVAHMAATYLQPFLASLATLLPAGVILGLFFHFGNSESRKLTDFLVRGFGAGAAIAGVTGCIWWLAWGSAPWIALFSWWTLVGIGIQFFVPAEPNATRFYQPICGILLAFCLMLALTLLPSSGSLYKSSGPVSTFALVARLMALTVVTSPDVPADPWIKVDRPVTARPKSPTSDATTSPPSQAPPSIPTPLATNGSPLATAPTNEDHTLGLTPPPAPAPAPGQLGLQSQTPLNWSGRPLAVVPTDKTPPATAMPELSASSSPPGQFTLRPKTPFHVDGRPPPLVSPPTSDNQSTRVPDSGLSFDARALANAPTQLPAPDPMGKLVERMDKESKDYSFDNDSILDRFKKAGTPAENGLTWRSVFAEMGKGLPSPLFRSWLVLILFGVGLGFAPVVEYRLRPSDYPSSATFKKDITIAIALLIAVAAACFTARTAPEASSTAAPPNSDASPHS